MGPRDSDVMLLLAGASLSLALPHKCLCEEQGGLLPTNLSLSLCLRLGFSLCAEEAAGDVSVQKCQTRRHMKRA